MWFKTIATTTPIGQPTEPLQIEGIHTENELLLTNCRVLVDCWVEYYWVL